MSSLAIDTLEHVRILEEAGFTRQQAEVQATILRRQAEAWSDFLQKALERYDDASRKEMAAKGDVLDVRLEVEKVRAELKLDIEQLRIETTQMKYDLLKWQLGMGLAVILVVAKGFGWLGFWTPPTCQYDKGECYTVFLPLYRSPYKYRASRYDHAADGYIPKKSSDRIDELSNGTEVQRDLYPSFLLYCFDLVSQDIDKEKCVLVFSDHHAKERSLIGWIRDDEIKILDSGIKVA